MSQHHREEPNVIVAAVVVVIKCSGKPPEGFKKEAT
jgi:hypothetical protein